MAFNADDFSSPSVAGSGAAFGRLASHLRREHVLHSHLSTSSLNCVRELASLSQHLCVDLVRLRTLITALWTRTHADARAGPEASSQGRYLSASAPATTSEWSGSHTGLDYPSLVSQLGKSDIKGRLVPTHTHLQAHAEHYTHFVSTLCSHPQELAQCVYQSKHPEWKKSQTHSVVVLALADSFLEPALSQILAHYLCSLARLHMKATHGTVEAFRRPSHVTEAFGLAARTTMSPCAPLVLKVARKAVTLAVHNYSIDLGVIFAGALQNERVRADAIAVAESIVCELMELIVAELKALPPVLSALLSTVWSVLQSVRAFDEPSRGCMADVLVGAVLAPAIASPELVGACKQIPLPPSVRRNLAVVSRLLLHTARGTRPKRASNDAEKDLLTRLNSKFGKTIFAAFEALPKVEPSTLHVPSELVPQAGRKQFVPLRVDEVFLLEDMVRSAIHTLEKVDIRHPLHQAMEPLSRAGIFLPDSGDDSDSSILTDYLVFDLSADSVEGQIGLLDEVLFFKTLQSQQRKARHQSTSGKPEEGPRTAPAPLDTSVEAVRQAMCLGPISSQWKAKSLDDVLKEMETVAWQLNMRKEAVAVTDAIRQLGRLSPEARGAGDKNIFRALRAGMRRRTEYTVYLSSHLQSLEISLAAVKGRQTSLQLAWDGLQQALQTWRVIRFLADESMSVSAMLGDIVSAPNPDERVSRLIDIGEEIVDKLSTHPWWQESGDVDIENSAELVERYIHQQLHSKLIVSDKLLQQSDEKLQGDISKYLADITTDHPKLQIPSKVCGFAPWKQAQDVLATLPSCLTPHDKLKCITEVCGIVAELVYASSKAPAGADDMLPILVFVTIKTNPSYLRSSVEYVNTFGQRSLEGEDSYWFMQFEGVIHVIQEMVDDAKGAPNASSRAFMLADLDDNVELGDDESLLV